MNVLASLVKMKVAALVLGPAGVGLVGLYMNLVSTAASVSSLGLGITGVRHIVNASTDGELAVGRARRVLQWGSLILAVAGAGVFWLCRGWVARVLLSDEARSNDVAWLCIGVGISVMVSAQTALLTGLRRVGDLARINIAAGVSGAILAVLVLNVWPAFGVLYLALATPALAFLVGRVYMARLGRCGVPRPRLPEVAKQFGAVIRPGIPFMFAGVITLLGQLVVRTLVQRELGLDALGQFQAAWSISVVYLGFVLGAMGTDYLPRLSALANDRHASVKLINEQTEVALLLAAPVVIATLAFSPWLIHLLYSQDFSPSVEVLRWQLLGDILKTITWPLGFMCHAWGAGKTFLAFEAFGAIVLALGVFFGIPYFGIAAAGVALFVLYALSVPLLWGLGRLWVGFRWTRPVFWQAVGIFAAAVLVDVTCRKSEIGGAVLGGLVAATLALWALIRLASLASRGSQSGRIGAMAGKVTGLLKVFKRTARVDSPEEL